MTLDCGNVFSADAAKVPNSIREETIGSGDCVCMSMSCSQLLDTRTQDRASTEDIQQRGIDLDLDTTESPSRLTVDALHLTENILITIKL
jgi:hypothetical protein